MDDSSEPRTSADREAYLECSHYLGNIGWLMGQYDHEADHALAIRANRFLVEARQYLAAALRYLTSAEQRECYEQHFNDLSERVVSALGAICEGDKIASARDTDARIRRTTLLNLYMLSRMLGHGNKQIYRDIAAWTNKKAGAIEQALRGYAAPYIERRISLADGLSCAFCGIDVESLADFDTFELMSKLNQRSAEALVKHGLLPPKDGKYPGKEPKVHLLSKQKAAELILRARAKKWAG